MIPPAATRQPAVLIRALAVQKDVITESLKPLASSFVTHLAILTASTINWCANGTAFAGTKTNVMAACNSAGEITSLHIVKAVNPVKRTVFGMRVHVLSLSDLATNTTAFNATSIPLASSCSIISPKFVHHFIFFIVFHQ